MRLIFFLTLFSWITAANAAEFFVLPGTTSLLVMGETMKSDVQTLKDYVVNERVDELILKGPGGNLEAGYEIAELVLKYELSIRVPENTDCASACSLIFSAGKKRTMEPGSRLGFHLPYLMVPAKDIVNYCLSFSNPSSSDESSSSNSRLYPFGALSLAMTNLATEFASECLMRTFQSGMIDLNKLSKILRRDTISEKIIDVIIQTPSNDMTWLDGKYAAEFGLTN